MTPEAFLQRIIDPALDLLAKEGGPRPNHDARRFLLAIALQEAGRGPDDGPHARYQKLREQRPGDARGWWQFEQGNEVSKGGVTGVLTHPSSRALAGKVCHHFAVEPHAAAVWRALEGHDHLAACFARLLVLTHPPALPTTANAGWEYYLKTWRPGTPHRHTWDRNWEIAEKTVHAAEIRA